MRPTTKEFLEAKNDLIDLGEEKSLIRDIILKKLAIISSNLIVPVKDEKEGEHETLLTSAKKDQELTTNKNSLEAD